MIGDQARAETASLTLKHRQMRDVIFPSKLFDEYAWDMLLHLFVALVGNEDMTETDLLGRSKAPPPVARRWITQLVDDGQIEARAEGADVVLTGEAVTRLRTYLDMIAPADHEAVNPER